MNMTMNRPRISVVTIVRNAPKDLSLTLASVRSQIILPFEHVIIDGLSSDETTEIGQEYQNAYPTFVKFLSEKDDGISDALNKGRRIASGEYVIFLNAGDVIYNADTLSHIIQAIGRAPVGAVIYGEAQLCYPGFVSKMSKVRHEYLDSVFGFFNPLCHQATVVSKALLANHPFRTDLRYSMDLELWLHLLNQKTPFFHDSFIYCSYQIGGISSNPKNIPALIDEHLRVYVESGRGYKIISANAVRLRISLERIGGIPFQRILSWYRKRRL